MKTELQVSEKQLELIKEKLQTAILRRGITAKITEIYEAPKRYGGSRIEFITEEFQTTPVMFRAVRVENFSSDITEVGEDVRKTDRKNVWIQASLRWEVFEGGSNGTKLFDFTCALSDNGRDIFEATVE